MTNEQTALAKVISLIHSECNRVADINSSYHDGIYEGLLIVLRHITTDGLLQYEREQMEKCYYDGYKKGDNDQYEQITGVWAEPADYFNQNYTQDGK